MTHTPEKWYVGYGHVFTVTGEDQVEIIAEHIRDEKTAHQIKAVPDMILALNNIIEHCEYERYPSCGEILRIAKYALKGLQ
jgi:hypothetical protein